MSSSVLPGTFNARDLGGLATADGGTVRRGLIVRSDAPIDLGETGRAVLRRLGVSAAIDLREPIECDLDPADLDGLGIAVAANPIFGEGFDLDKSQTLEEIYREMLARRGDRFAAALARLADPGSGPAIVFCSAGKDRTGLVSALLLSVLGVDDETIVEDYHRTELNMQGRFREEVIARAAKAGISDQEIATKVGAPIEVMRAILAWLRQEFGGVEAYLGRQGLTSAELQSLRDRLVQPAAAARCA